MQTPLFTGETWSTYHTNVLSHIGDEDLAASDYGMYALAHKLLGAIALLPMFAAPCC